MSYNLCGYMTCEPLVYWGHSINYDWAEFVKNVDVCNYLGKYRYIQDALSYLDRIEFVSSDREFYGEDEVDWDWLLSRRGEITQYFGDYDWEKTILFPLSKNSFPFVIATEGEVEEVIKLDGVEREEVLGGIPDSFQNENELEEYIRENLDAGEQYENLSSWDIKIHSPEPRYDKEMEQKNFDEHMGMDVLLDFLAKSGVVNRDFKDWLVTFHMVGEDGEEYSWARKIVGNEVKNPHEQKSLW
ncbi:MAG: hypothetical protein P8P49_02360 [Opitutales bacterium]|nr:hypothetical protein [Opitutales bacterium]